MKTKVILRNNSREIKLFFDFPLNALCDYGNGKVSAIHLINSHATPYQRKRIDKFCASNDIVGEIDTTEIEKNCERAKDVARIREQPRSCFYEKFTGNGIRCGRIGTGYEIKNPIEFADRYAAENGYARYEIVDPPYKFQTTPDVYFAGERGIIGFFKK